MISIIETARNKNKIINKISLQVYNFDYVFALFEVKAIFYKFNNKNLN